MIRARIQWDRGAHLNGKVLLVGILRVSRAQLENIKAVVEVVAEPLNGPQPVIRLVFEGCDLLLSVLHLLLLLCCLSFFSAPAGTAFFGECYSMRPCTR